MMMANGRPDLRAIEQGAVSVPVRALTDSENLSQSIRRDAGSVQDRRLRIVIAMLRQTVHDRGSKHVTTIEWVPTYKMVADALTKIMDRGMIQAFLMSSAFVARPRTMARTIMALHSLKMVRADSDSGSEPRGVSLRSALGTVLTALQTEVVLPLWVVLLALGALIILMVIVLRPTAPAVKAHPAVGQSLPKPETETAPRPSPQSPRFRESTSAASTSAMPIAKPTTDDSIVDRTGKMPPKCPLCGRNMIKKAANAGGKFWGCPIWPKCKGTRRPFEHGK